jgi:hypothetical protein
MIRPCLLPVGMSTSNRIIKQGYEFYQPIIAARQFGLGQVPPHFFFHHLTTNRADLPDVITTQKCYSLFSDLLIPIPVDLSFTSSAIDFENWWSMWKTHVFRKALGPICSRFTLSMKPLKKRYYFQFNVFPLTSLNSFSNFICSLCSRKMVRSPGMMMAPPSSFHRLPRWFFLAETHLLHQRPLCGSNLAPQNQLPSGSSLLTLLPLEPKLRRGR